jgi:uridine kinase
MAKPYIIGIAGESGVGKSTIAAIISLFYGAENTAVISTDDLHKWERTNPVWETITHLNPEANNLELGDIHLSEISQGKPIYRSVYNHRTGFFDPPKRIDPRPVVVVEGLHAFYTETSKDLIDLKVYVDTNEELKTHWKIIRDTEDRGYKYNMVLDAIHKRRHDRFSFASNRLMNIYCSGFNNIEYIFEMRDKKDGIFCGETILYEMFKLYNIPHTALPMHANHLNHG